MLFPLPPVAITSFWEMPTDRLNTFPEIWVLDTFEAILLSHAANDESQLPENKIPVSLLKDIQDTAFSWDPKEFSEPLSKSNFLISLSSPPPNAIWSSWKQQVKQAALKLYVAFGIFWEAS